MTICDDFSAFYGKTFSGLPGLGRYTKNIAVVGGGTRCKRLIEVIQRHAFQEIDPRVVAVADLNENAPGYVKAKNSGLFVTHDYNDFFVRQQLPKVLLCSLKW